MASTKPLTTFPFLPHLVQPLNPIAHLTASQTLSSEGEKSVERGVADRVAPQVNVDWRRRGQRQRFFRLIVWWYSS